MGKASATADAKKELQVVLDRVGRVDAHGQFVKIAQILVESTSSKDQLLADLLVEMVLIKGEQLLSAGDVATWVKGLGVLWREIGAQQGIGPVRVLHVLLERLGQEQAVRSVVQPYRSDSAPRISFLESYLSMLPATALGSVARCFRSDLKPRVAAVLKEYLIQACRDHAEGVGDLVQDPDPEVARRGVQLLPEVPQNRVGEMMQKALAHADQGVRAESLKEVEDLPIKFIVAPLSAALQDSEGSVRKAATRLLARGAVVESVRALLGILQKKEFRRWDEDEQLHLWLWLAKSGRPEALGAVEKRLMPPQLDWMESVRARLTRRPVDEFRARLITELGQLSTPQVREILQRGLRSRDPAFARACRQALENAAPTPQ